ncbi:MAG: Ubiquitin carboxyl-terminal hydrolase 22 [Marteilia pararefringens]
MSSTELANSFNEGRDLTISPSYLRTVLFANGLRSYKAVKKPFLNRKMKKRRLEFARTFVGKPASFWRNVFFSDESCMEINMNSTMNRVRRFKSSSPLNPLYTTQRVKYPLKVMIWGCFNYKSVGRIHVCDGNMNSSKYLEVLENKLLPSIEDAQIENPLHLDDSAPCHRTLAVKEWHKSESIGKIDWPGNSPDLNPIENLWSIIKYKIRRRTITTKRKLISEIIKIWNHEISEDLLKILADSMTKRLEDVIKVKGEMTKY